MVKKIFSWRKINKKHPETSVESRKFGEVAIDYVFSSNLVSHNRDALIHLNIVEQ